MVNWGVLTTATIAHDFTIPAMKQAENCRLVGIAGRNMDKVNKFKEEFGFEKAYSSPEELLNDKDIQAVYIPMPNQLHYEWIKRAADAGKHILCEKPLTANYKDTADIIEYCEGKGVHIMEAFAYLHAPHIAKVKQIVNSGEIGEISFLESCFYTPFYTSENIRVRRETLGGSIYDLGCYCTSLMLYLFEKEPDEIKAVGHFTDQHIDDAATAYFWYNDGRKAVMSCGMCSDTRGDRFFVYGTKGKIEVPIQFNEKGVKEIYIFKNDKKETVTINIPNNYMLETEQFGRVIENGEKPLVSAEFSKNNAKILDKLLSEIGY